MKFSIETIGLDAVTDLAERLSREQSGLRIVDRPAAEAPIRLTDPADTPADDPPAAIDFIS